MPKENSDKLLKTLEEKANIIRRHIVRTIAKFGAGHTAPALSYTDIVTALYFHVMQIDPRNPAWPDRDRFILSKGHGCVALYATLAECGFFDVEILDTLCQLNSTLGGHPDMHKVPGIEASTGSLGHGLPIAVGMALAGKHDKKNYRVFAVLSDGECDEGSTWEAAMAASHYKLDNLIAVVDRNRLQCDGWCKEIMDSEPLAKKWSSFGWFVQEIKGHDMRDLLGAFGRTAANKVKPAMIIAHTIKGKGVSFMENQPSWHYRELTTEEAKRALEELSATPRS